MFLHPFMDKYYKPKLQQFWRVEKGKGKLVTLQWKNLQMLPYPKLTWPAIRTPHDTMWYPLTEHVGKGTSLDFLPTSPDFLLIMRRHQTNVQWWTFYKIPDWYFSKGSRSYEQKTENHHRPQTGVDQGEMVAKCNVESWTGSWNRKRTLVTNRGNPNKVQSIVNSILPIFSSWF